MATCTPATPGKLPVCCNVSTPTSPSPCLLAVDPDKLGVPVIAENLTGGHELFPHIYGAVPVTAVVEVAALVRDGQSGWRSPVG